MKERLTALLPTFLVIVFLLSAVGVNAQCPPGRGTEYRGCPACGKVLSVRAQRDNLLKNRDESAEQVKALSISDIRDPKLNGSFFPDMAVEITGYVARVVSGGVKETANCRRPDLRNIRILLVASPNEAANATKYVVLEITPRWEKTLGLDDSNIKLMIENARKLFAGKWVTFRGWMFYNLSFVDEAQSTNPGLGDVWRATPWEVHPVTSYKVLSGPPENVTRRQNENESPTTSRGVRLLTSVDPLLYSAYFFVGRKNEKVESNHATALIPGECLRSCVDFYNDKVANCPRVPPRRPRAPLRLRNACFRKANQERHECRLECVD